MDLRPRILSPSSATIGLMLAGLVTALSVAGSLELTAGHALGLEALGVAALAALGLGCWTERRLSRALGGFAVAVAILGAGLALASTVTDTSYDGQAYHQEAVLRLAAGWNPLHDPPLPEAVRNAASLNCYPKAAWIAEALLFRLTGRIETAKGIQVAMLIAAFLLCFAALRERGAGRARALVIAALLACTPVTLNQLGTFYVDGLLASSLTLLGALAVRWWHEPARELLVAMGLLLAFLANLKFTGVVYGCVFAAGFVLLSVRRQPSRRREVITATGFSLLCAVLLVGAQPYVTNTLRHRHPFHPLMGAQAIDILVVGPSAAFRAHSRVVQLAASVFGRSTNEIGADPQLKWPLTVHAGELRAFSAVDTRLGGFGPLFSAALLAALALLWMAFRRGVASGELLAVIAAVLLSVLITPAAFWARLAPQLWMVPALALLALPFGASALPRSLRFVWGLCAALLVLDLGLAFAPCAATELFVSHCRRRQLRALGELAHGAPLTVDYDEFPSLRRAFEEAHVSVAAGPLDCPSPSVLVFSKARVCLPGAQSPPPAPRPADELHALLGL